MSDIRFRKTADSRYRNIKVYYRNSEGIMVAVPGVRIFLLDDSPLELYTVNVPIRKMRVDDVDG